MKKTILEYLCKTADGEIADFATVLNYKPVLLGSFSDIIKLVYLTSLKSVMSDIPSRSEYRHVLLNRLYNQYEKMLDEIQVDSIVDKLTEKLLKDREKKKGK